MEDEAPDPISTEELRERLRKIGVSESSVSDILQKHRAGLPTVTGKKLNYGFYMGHAHPDPERILFVSEVWKDRWVLKDEALPPKSSIG